MGEKIGDLTIGDIKALIALGKRDIEVRLVEIEYDREKLRLLYIELGQRLKEKDKANGE